MQSLYWPFEDPATATGDDDARLAAFRRSRDEFEARILRWLEQEQESR